MFTKTIKHRWLTAALTLLMIIASLWSWNALADLIGAPQAQLKHIIAAMILLAASRCIMKPHRGKTRHAHEH